MSKKFRLRARFNLHGLSLGVRADHPVPFHAIVDELQSFRTENGTGANTLWLTLETLGRRNETGMLLRKADASVETSAYQRDILTVVLHFKKRHIRVLADPDAALYPDPAYHRCFSRPVGFWLKQRGLFFLHAGCVAENGKGILIAGPARAGKSTLSLSAVRAGFKFLSDEQPLLGLRDGRVTAHCFPRRIRLDRKSAARFPELREAAAAGSDERVIFPIESIRPRCLQSVCPLSLLIFPRFKKIGPMKFRPIDPAAALAKLLEDDHFVGYRNKPLDKISRQHLDLFGKLVGQASAYTLEYTDREIPAVPALLRKLLRETP